MLDHIKKKKINKNEYQIELLPARKGFSRALKLSKIILPALGSSFDALEDNDGNGFTRVAYMLVEQMDEAEIPELIDDLLEGSAVNGKELDFDTHFRANYGELVEVLEFALRENFGSFFEAKGLKERFSKLKEMVVPTADQTQEESSD